MSEASASGRLIVLPVGQPHPAWCGLSEADLWPVGTGDDVPDADAEQTAIYGPMPEPDDRLSDLPPNAPVVAHAIAYARRGFEIMPRVATSDGNLIDGLRGSPRTGLIDVDEVTASWQRHPRTSALAAVLGPRSGLFVVDCDQHPGGADGLTELAVLERQRGPLPPTVLSASGRGRHLYFRWPSRPVRSGAIAPGVEVLADRAAATLPPSVKRGRPYRWKLDRHLDYVPPPPAPAWLLDLAAPPAPRPRQHRDRDAVTAPERYVAAAIADEVSAVQSAPPGDRNRQLNRSAWALARFVRDGATSRDQIEDELLAAAAQAGLRRREALPTIRSGLRRVAP